MREKPIQSEKSHPKTQHQHTVRIVKVKCPECYEIFSTELSKEKTDLKCPYCGFTGGY